MYKRTEHNHLIILSCYKAGYITFVQVSILLNIASAVSVVQISINYVAQVSILLNIVSTLSIT